MKVLEGSLRIRSPRTASRYIGAEAALPDEDGFVDTGDMVELRGDRYVFAGRRGGIINIGGLKVHPEEDRGGDQPASAGAHVAGAAEGRARSPARS